jgi:hypothetical protein
MKKILLIISTLLFAGYSHGKEIKGEMICKVKSNYVVAINEGKPEIYSGIEGSFAKGDSLIFKFNTDDFLTGWVHIKLYYKDKVLGSMNVTNSKYSYDEKKIELTDSGFKYGSQYRNVRFYSDHIYLESRSNEFRIQRYYKSDWSGIISGKYFPAEGGLGEKIATLDCRQSSDRVDDFIQYVKKMAENE